MNEVESFALDHTKLRVPYVRECLYEELGNYRLFKYDLRFVQPNKERIPASAIHSIEHLLATTMRHQGIRVVDFSPMGCQTGFYLVLLDSSRTVLIEALKDAMEEALNIQEVPGATRKECGSADMHDLGMAKKYIQRFLDGYDRWTEVFA